MLKDAGATPEILELNCGHYSLGMQPQVIWAGLGLLKLVRRGG